MFWACFRFEMLLRLKSASTWIALLTIGALNLWQYMSAHWDKLVGAGSVARNSPFSIYNSFMVTSFWAAVLGCAYMTAPLLRDLRLRIAPVVYACPINDRTYFWAKYLAGLVCLYLVMTSQVIATWLLPVVGPMITPPVQGEYMPTAWAHIGYAWLIFVVPGVFIVGTIHYVLAVSSAKVTPSYALAAGFLLLWAALGVAFEGAKTVPLSAQLLDPLAKLPLELMVFKWSPAQRMGEFVDVMTPLGLNRLLYLIAAVVMLAVTAARLDLRRFMARDKPPAARKSAKDSTVQPVTATGPSGAAFKSTSATASTRWLAEAFGLGWRDFKLCFREAPFLLLVALCALFSLTGALKVYAAYQSVEGALLPITIDVIQLAVESFFIGGLMTVLFYAGEIIARDRIPRAYLITDSSPIPDWAQQVGKLAAIALLATFLTLIPGVVAFAVQLLKGYVDGDVANYVYRIVFLLWPSLLAFGALAAILHGLAGHRGLGHGLTIGLALAFCIGHEVDFLSHPLSKWGLSGFHTTYTQFEAFQQFQQKLLETDAYWLLMSAVLLIAVYWLWPRGIELGLRARLATFRRNFSSATLLSFAAAAGAMTMLGWSIHSRAVVNNHSLSHVAEVMENAAYEKRYGDARAQPLPKIIAATLDVELNPQQRTAVYSSDYTVANTTAEPIDVLQIEVQPFVHVVSASWNGTPLEPSSVDEEFGRLEYRLAMPLAAREQAKLRMQLEVRYQDYVAKGYHGTLLKEGAVLESKMWPRFGYDAGRELLSRGDRVRNGLSGRALPPLLDAAANAQRAYRTSDADLVRTTLRVSTPEHQIAVAAGTLVEERTEAGKRIRTYSSDVDAVWELPIAASSYEVARSDASVPIEVYFDPRHKDNTQRFIDATRFALERLTALFGPYPYSSVRIAETPNGVVEAQGARGLILLPELKGWTHDYRGEQPFDNISFVIAKELARAWLIERRPPAWLRGAQALDEGLPTLVALALLEERHGAPMAQRYVADKLEFYLRESAREDGIEPTLIDGYDQEYLAAKSVVALWSARSILGPDATMASIREFHALPVVEGRPWSDLGQLLTLMRASASDDTQRQLLSELFESVRVHDFSIGAVTSHAAAEAFTTTFQLNARSFGIGESSDKAVNNRVRTETNGPVEVAALDSNGAVLNKITVTVAANGTAFEIASAQRPEALLIDPDWKRLDESRLNNRVDVQR